VGVERCFFIQASLFLRNFFFYLRCLAYRGLKFYTTSLIYAVIYRFIAIWHRLLVAALVLYWRLAESDVTVTPSFTCMN
jgi:hypothetical protein